MVLLVFACKKKENFLVATCYVYICSIKNNTIEIPTLFGTPSSTTFTTTIYSSPRTTFPCNKRSFPSTPSHWNHHLTHHHNWIYINGVAMVSMEMWLSSLDEWGWIVAEKRERGSMVRMGGQFCYIFRAGVGVRVAGWWFLWWVLNGGCTGRIFQK